MRNNIIILVDKDGNLLREPIGLLRADSNHTSRITVVAPFDLKTIVSVAYQKDNRIQNNITTFMIPNGILKGKDVITDDKSPFYQAVYNWNVWENDIDPLVVAYLATFTSSMLSVSANFDEQLVPHYATTHRGSFGLNNPLPETADEGDFWICNTFNFHQHDITFTVNDYAYYHNDNWYKSNYYGIAGTEPFKIPVSGNIPSNIEVISDQDLAVLLAGRVAVLESDLDNLELRVETNEINIGDLQTNKADKTDLIPINNELARLETDKADKTYVDAQDVSLGLLISDNTDRIVDLEQDKADITYVDNEGANTLQQAKDYTYSQVEIDNKDTAIMNKANNLENANMLKDVVYNNVNGVLTFTKYDDTTKEIDLPLELIVTSGYYDEVANELVLVLANSSEIRIPVDNLLTDLDAHNIRFNGSGTNYLVNKNDVESAVKELDTRVKGANDLLEDKVDNNELAQLYGGKNLGGPDLTNKDYLGDGWYLLDDIYGLKLEYNVFNGTFRIHGVKETGTPELRFMNILANNLKANVNYMFSVVDVYNAIPIEPNLATAKSNPVIYRNWTTIINTAEDKVGSFVYTTSDFNINFYVWGGLQKIDKYFKLQIEQGTIATPYTLPMFVTPELLDNKVDKVNGKGLSTNDFTNDDKAKIDTLETSKQDKLIAGENITIEDNVISAVGGSGGGYEPDGVTIVLNNSDELEVSKELEVEWTKVVNKPTFSTVATTGSYNDLDGKPDLTEKLDKDFSALPNQASPLLTDVLAINRGAVAQKTTLGNLLAQVDAEIFIVVATLPASGLENKIYLVPKTSPDTNDGYDEYIWKDSAWELLGSLTLDLSNYYNKTEVNGLLSSKVDKNNAITAGTKTKITYDAKGLVTGGSDLAASDIPPLAISKVTNLQSSLDNKVDKIAGKGLSTNDYTDEDKQNVEKILTIEQDIVDLENDKVDKNNPITVGTKTKITYDSKGLVTSGDDLVAADIPNLDADKITTGTFVDARIPNLNASKINAGTFDAARIPNLAPSKITQNATNRFVTDTEKSTWNSKQSALGFTPENQANKKTTLTNNDVDFPTTKAVKTAIDTAISQTLKPMGNWDASTNTPTLLATDINRANQVYYVNVAGTQFGINFDVGDELVYNTNGVIFKRDNVDAVISVNGKEGVVVLTQDDVADGSTYKRVTETEKTTWNNKVTSNTAITGATKTKITFDEKGLVTAGADLVESDIPALSPTKITQNTTNRFVTDNQISTWNAKQEALPTITQAQINAGTSTTEVVITPKLLRDNFYTETEIDNMIGDIESVLDTILGV